MGYVFTNLANRGSSCLNGCMSVDGLAKSSFKLHFNKMYASVPIYGTNNEEILTIDRCGVYFGNDIVCCR